MTKTLTKAVLLAASIIKFLEAEAETMSESDKKEGLKVAASCIKHSFGVTDQVLASPGLYNMYDLHSGPTASASMPRQPSSIITSQMREQAEQYKQAGNQHLVAKRAIQAAEEYTRALELDPENAVYYCNRAAAFTMAEDYDSAIEDCRAAISLNPKYAKAYSRLGAAYSAVNNWDLAVDAYQKAINLEPENAAYQASLQQAQARIKSPTTPQSSSSQSRSSPSGLGGGNLDFASLMNNPDIMQMASRMMQDPNALRNMMNSPQVAAMMQGMMGGAGGNHPQAKNATEEEDNEDQ